MPSKTFNNDLGREYFTLVGSEALMGYVNGLYEYDDAVGMLHSLRAMDITGPRLRIDRLNGVILPRDKNSHFVHNDDSDFEERSPEPVYDEEN